MCKHGTTGYLLDTARDQFEMIESRFSGLVTSTKNRQLETGLCSLRSYQVHTYIVDMNIMSAATHSS